MAGADRPFDRPLRRGWTTGACATAAAKAACAALVGGAFPDPVEIALPGGAARRPSRWPERDAATDRARAGIVKDAGDDPDVTHGALIMARVRARSRRAPASRFARGRGRRHGDAAGPAAARRASRRSIRCRAP